MKLATMDCRALLQFLVLLLAIGTLCSAYSSDSVPVHPSFQPDSCDISSPPSNKRIIDISHTLRPDLPVFETDEGLDIVIQLLTSIANGSVANQSEMKLAVHSGTHVDAPSHFYQEYYDAGYNVDTLDLDVLNGLGLVVDVPRDTNLTAKAMQALNIPYGVERVLFRTLNTDRRLMWKRQFESNYVGFTTDGAQWLAENTNIKLVGVDYLSAASYDHLVEAHLVFLKSREIILLEGLNLDDIDLGVYELHCLPLKLLRSDGSPCRCILEK